MPKSYGFEVGGFFGEPTGISGGFGPVQGGRIDALLAYSLSDDRVVLGADWVRDFAVESFRRSTKMPFSPFWGLGGVLSLGNNRSGLALRVPVGLSWRSSDIPIHVFAELVPALALLPDTEGDLQGGVGVRYRF